MGTTADKIALLKNTKAEIKTAIENKGVEVGTIPFSEYAEKINSIQSGGGSGEEIQGVVYNAFPLNQSTQVKFIPSDFTKNITSFRHFFYNYQKLETIPPLDTSNGTDFYQMFASCPKLTSIPPLDTSNGTDFDNMFNNCSSLTSIPPLDTSNGTNFNGMFNNCRKLETIPPLDASNATKIGTYTFFACYGLKNFGGFINAKVSFDLRYSLLTHQSLLNVLNGLYDLTGGTSQTLTLSSTNLKNLTDEEKAIATNKNWVLA